DDVPKVAEDRSETGLGVRAAKAKRVAFSATTLASPSDVRSAVAAAMAGLKRVPEDPDFSGFPTEAGTGEVSGAGDARTGAMDVSIRTIDFAHLGATVARRAAANLKARAFKGKLPGIAVLDPLDLGEVFLTTVGSAVNGEDVHKGRSPWAGKVGQEIASAGV